jgi:hypothetical protein
VPAAVWNSIASRLPNARRVVPTSEAPKRDRSGIVVDEWGPYDWRSPKLWPIDSTHATPLRLRVLGPAGTWKLLSRRGVSKLSMEAGRMGDTLVVTPSTNGEWSVRLEYRGGATVSPRGERRGAGVPYVFSYEVFEPPMDWTVNFYQWRDSSASAMRGAPLLSRHESRLDYMWYRPTIKELPLTRWAAEATTSVTLEPGVYTLRAISDDAIRVWVDGTLVIDDWTPHESAVDNAALSGGRHEIRVEYAQVDGWVELRVEIVRGRQRSIGSAGPH